MPVKIVSGIVGVILLLVYVAPVAVKLKEISLWTVVVIGVGMMLVDLWQSLRAEED